MSLVRAKKIEKGAKLKCFYLIILYKFENKLSLSLVSLVAVPARIRLAYLFLGNTNEVVSIMVLLCREICAHNEEVQKQMAHLFRPLAKGYLELLKLCHLSDSNEFFGLRDFYRYA